MEWIDLKIPGCGGLSLAMENGSSGRSRPWLLEARADSVIYLGAVRDAMGEPREWVEIWIQETAGLEGRLASEAREATGPVIDARWRRMADGYAAAGRESVIRGPWETVHGHPLLLKEDGTGVADEGDEWELCQDDGLLERNRLAGFSGSGHRYLVSGDGRFVPLTEGAPRSPATVEFDVAFPGMQAVNREAGLMMVRRLAGLKYESFVDFLGGKDFGQSVGELLRVPPVGVYGRFLEKNARGQAWVGFIHGRANVSERLAEILFLKLSVLRGAFEVVSASVAAQKMPFLGLSADSFGVSLAEPAAALPFLWNQRVSLCAVPSVVGLPMDGEQVLVPCADISRSVYRAERLVEARGGSGRVRIRKITPPDDSGFSIIEGTLQTDEALEVSRKDLLEVDLRFQRGRRFKIYGNFVGQKGSPGEYRFLSRPLVLPAEMLGEVEEGGVQGSEKVEFRVIPGLGSTSDLYSMGVLAVRTIFNSETSLGETLDDLLSLMRAYGHTFEASQWETGTGNLLSFIHSDKGRPWKDKLGPQRVATGVSAEDATQSIPGPLWWLVVEFAGRLFPGEMPGSFAKDFDDFDARAPEQVFVDPVASLDGLLETGRSLLFGNPLVSREILSVIQGYAAKLNG